MTLIKNRTLYISGGMSNLPNFNFAMFDSVQSKCVLLGATDVYSPAAHDRATIRELYGPTARPEDFPGYATGDLAGYFDAVSSGGKFVLESMLRWDFTVIINEIDAIVMLPGWEKSTGARWERLVAEAMSLDIILAVQVPVHGGPGHSWAFDLDLDQKRLTNFLKHNFTAPARPIDNKLGIQPTPLPEVPDPYERSHWHDRSEFADGPKVLGSLKATEAYEHIETLETRVVDPTTGGAKGLKLARFDLLPWRVLWELAEHYGRGARKYEDRNWERGYAWSLSFAALHRHLAAFWNRDEFDDDPSLYLDGEPHVVRHIIAVVWHACALAWFSIMDKGTDDRPR